MNFFLAAFLSLVSAFAWACDAAGPNTHVGPVTAIDHSGGTFTIIDAQTHLPITFSAPESIIKEAARGGDSLAVSFREEKGRLIAVGIH